MRLVCVAFVYAVVVEAQPRLTPLFEISEPWATTQFSKAASDANGNIFVSGHHTQESNLAWRTDNAGRTWDVLPEMDGVISGIFPDPQDPAIVYALRDAGLFKSNDAGKSWRRILDGANQFTIDGGNPRILIATNGNEVLRSADAGENWATLPVQAYGWLSLDPSGTGGGIITGVAPRNAWITRDRGATWKAIPGFPAIPRPAVFRPSRPGWAYVVEEGGVIRWTEDLERWNEFRSPNSEVSSIYFDPLMPNRIWISDERGIHWSDDHGKTWALSTAKGTESELTGCGTLEAIPPTGPALRYDRVSGTWTEFETRVGGIRYGAGCVGYGLTRWYILGFLAKYTPDGKLVWKQTYPSFFRDWALAPNGDTVGARSDWPRAYGRRDLLSRLELRDTQGRLVSSAEPASLGRESQAPDNIFFDAFGNYHYSALFRPFGPSVVVKYSRDGDRRYSVWFENPQLLTGVDPLGRAAVASIDGLWLLDDKGAKLARIGNGSARTLFAENGDPIIVLRDVARYEAGTWKEIWRTEPLPLDTQQIQAALDSDEGVIIEMVRENQERVFLSLDRNGKPRDRFGTLLNGKYGLTPIPDGSFVVFSSQDGGKVRAERLR